MKDPAFLFYPSDFMSGTMFFTDEQVGKYIRLLCAQHLSGHLEENHMILICKSYDKHIWSKFKKDDEGSYYNERLEDEVLKRTKYCNSRSINKLGKKKEKIISKSYENHMGNENENINIVSSNIDFKLIEDCPEKEKKITNKKVVRKFKHLSINETEYAKLIERGYSQDEINGIFDRIENYKKNTSYSSLYLTSINWLEKQYPDRKPKSKTEVGNASYWDQLKPEYK